MSTLLLTQGDPAALNLLRRAIAARYFISPPALESLRVDYRGRGHVKLGHMHSWVPLEAVLFFHFPDSMRWNYTIKPLGVTLRRGSGSFVKGTFYSEQQPAPVTHSTMLEHLRLSIWAMGALMLTPLSQPTIYLESRTDHSFIIHNTENEDQFEVLLYDDYLVRAIRFSSPMLSEETRQPISICPSREQTVLDGLTVPRRVEVLRGSTLLYEADVANVAANPMLSTSFFRADTASA